MSKKTIKPKKIVQPLTKLEIVHRLENIHSDQAYCMCDDRCDCNYIQLRYGVEALIEELKKEGV